MLAAHARNVALTPQLARFVDELVAAGACDNASEVARDGLRELQRRKHAEHPTEIQARIGAGLDGFHGLARVGAVEVRGAQQQCIHRSWSQ